MKITLDHDEVLQAVRESLLKQGLNAPELPDELGNYILSLSEEGRVTVQIDQVTIRPVVTVQEVAPVAQPVTGKQPQASTGRFDPIPPPPREKLDEPDRVFTAEGEALPERIENQRSIRGLVNTSNEMAKKGPVSSSENAKRHRSVTVGTEIEDLGKDPTDFRDEL